MTQNSNAHRSVLIGAGTFLFLITAAYLLENRSLGSADCIWQNTAQAWVDENQNGSRDNGEAPLAGVEFIIDDIRNDYKDLGDEAISDENGNAQVSVWLPGCPPVEFEIYANPPEGFQPNTPDRVPVSNKSTHNPGDDIYIFGFISSAQE